MAEGLTTLYNQALDQVGARNNLSSPTENSLEAETCTRWYSHVRDQVLASARWPEATKMDYLALLSEQDDAVWTLGEPRVGYQYAYAVPSDLLRPQYLADYSRFILMAYGADNRAIMTNSYQAVMLYTFRQDNINMWSPELRMAIMYGLAATICMPLSGKPSRARTLIDKANQIVYSARETAANTDNEQLEVLPDWISARGYSSADTFKFYYPLGSALSISDFSANVN